MEIVKQEKRNTWTPNVLNAAAVMSPSMTIMITPIFIENAFDINCANMSVPPVLVLYRSIRPTPTPIQMPPNNTLGKIESENLVLKGANQSINTEATINPIKLL